MKKSLVIFMSSLVLILGLFTLNGGTVGDLVSSNETHSITGGACYTYIAEQVDICAINCSVSNVKSKFTDYASGFSLSTQKCTTTGSSQCVRALLKNSCSGG